MTTVEEHSEKSSNVGDVVDVSPEQDGGVMKTLLKSGISNSHPKKGDTVNVHYIGTLDDGSQFDSSRDRGETFSFTLCRGQVIKAWDAAVAAMTRGEICKIHCTAKYAYGEAGSPPKIPPNANLNFEMELINWEGEDISPDKDGSITRTIRVEGEKQESPNTGANIHAHIVAFHEGRKFIDDDFQFLLGECTEAGLPNGVDKALKRFKKGETSTVNMKPKWGYGRKSKYGIPPNAALDLEISLKDFDNVRGYD